MSILGAEIIDTCVIRRRPDEVEDQTLSYLRQTRQVIDWDAKEGTVKGHGGRIGARELAKIMKSAISDDEVDIGEFERALSR